MPAGPRKPVERHNGRVYWPTRDVAVGFVDFFHAPGRILGTQTFRAAGVVRIGTQRIPRGRDRILGTQRIPRGRDPDGGDVDENGCFLRVKTLCIDQKSRLGRC